MPVMNIAENPNKVNGKTLLFISEMERLLNTLPVNLKSTNNRVPKKRHIDKTWVDSIQG